MANEKDKATQPPAVDRTTGKPVTNRAPESGTGEEPTNTGKQDNSLTAADASKPRQPATPESVGNMPSNPQNRRRDALNRPLDTVNVDPNQPPPERNPNMASGEDDPSFGGGRSPNFNPTPTEARRRENVREDISVTDEPVDDPNAHVLDLEITQDGRSSIWAFFGDLVANGLIGHATKLMVMWTSPSGVSLSDFQNELYAAIGAISQKKADGKFQAAPRGAGKEFGSPKDIPQEEQEKAVAQIRRVMTSRGIIPENMNPNLWGVIVPFFIMLGQKALELLLSKLKAQQASTPNRMLQVHDLYRYN